MRKRDLIKQMAKEQGCKLLFKEGLVYVSTDDDYMRLLFAGSLSQCEEFLKNRKPLPGGHQVKA